MSKKNLFLNAVETGSHKNFQMYFKSQYLEKVFYNNKRPIHIACEKGHFEIVKLLIEKQCNINETGECLKRPIHIACEKGFLEIVELLVRNRCEINENDTSQQNPIHFACSIGHVDIVKILIANKSKINVFNQWNESPIHLACQNGHCEIVKILISHNCDIDVVNHRKESALDIAKQKKHEEIIKLIEEYKFEKMLIHEMILKLNLKCETGCDHKFCSISIEKNDFSKIQTKKTLNCGHMYICKSSTSNMKYAVKTLTINSNDKIKVFGKTINELTKNLHHEKVVKYFGVTKNENQLQIFMEYIDGRSLNEILKEELLSWITTMAYTKQILQGLDYLHSKNIIHRNLQPSKVLLDTANNIKLVDFIEYKSLLPTFYSSFHETSNFMAPEVKNRNCHEKSANIWSLGAIIVYMLTGNPPTQEMLLSEVMDNIKKKTTLPPEIKEIEIMNQFMNCLLHLEPTKRSSASQLLKHKIFYILQE